MDDRRQAIYLALEQVHTMVGQLYQGSIKEIIPTYERQDHKRLDQLLQEGLIYSRIMGMILEHMRKFKPLDDDRA